MGCGSSTSTGPPPRTTTTDRTLSPVGGDRGRGRDSPTPTNDGGRGRVSPKPRNDGGRGKDDFVEEALRSHNEFRALHDAPPLTVAEDLNAYSQKWANDIARRDTMEHSNCTMDNGTRVGENIYYFWSSNPNAEAKAHDAVKSWYDEIKDYNYNNPTFGMNTGHFTQVVWKGSRELGIAKAKSSTGKCFVVANYRPPGNMMGDFENNVLPKRRSNV